MTTMPVSLLDGNVLDSAEAMRDWLEPCPTCAACSSGPATRSPRKPASGWRWSS